MISETFAELLNRPDHRFADTLAFIEEHYVYQPSAFANGPVGNSHEENQGSCKVLAMAMELGLGDEQALRCFAEHYQAVLADPDGSAHANIRALIEHGLAGVSFERQPLTRRL